MTIYNLSNTSQNAMPSSESNAKGATTKPRSRTKRIRTARHEVSITSTTDPAKESGNSECGYCIIITPTSAKHSKLHVSRRFTSQGSADIWESLRLSIRLSKSTIS